MEGEREVPSLLKDKKNIVDKENKMADSTSYMQLLERGKEIDALLELSDLNDEDKEELEHIWRSLKSRKESKFDAIISVIKECDRHLDRVEKDIQELKSNHEHWKNKRKHIINIIKNAYSSKLISAMPTGNKYQATIKTVKSKLVDNFKSWTDYERKKFGLRKETTITRIADEEILNKKEEDIPDKEYLRKAIENETTSAPAAAKLVKRVSFTYNLRKRIKTGI
jgi:hypothetical protein